MGLIINKLHTSSSVEKTIFKLTATTTIIFMIWYNQTGSMSTFYQIALAAYKTLVVHLSSVSRQLQKKETLYAKADNENALDCPMRPCTVYWRRPTTINARSPQTKNKFLGYSDQI